MPADARVRHREHLLALMRSTDNRAIKNGIQGAYQLLRDHPETPARYVMRVRYELSRHLTNQDPYVTPWIYSLIGTLRDIQYEPYLQSQLKNHEFDPVNRTWAIASLAAVAEDYRQVLHTIDDDLTLPYQLASAMYRGQVTDAQPIRLASDSDDRLAHLWVCLLFSEERADIPVAQIKELTGSSDAEIAQYALFALHKRPRMGIDSVMIGPQDLMNLHPRVRRWYYQLLIKDESNLVRYGSLVRHWMMVEMDTQAREGLAKGFISSRPPRSWIHELRAWAESEQDPYVLDALSQIPAVNDIISGRRKGRERKGPDDEETDDVPSIEIPENSFFTPPRPSISITGSQIYLHIEKGWANVDMRDQSVNIGDNNTIGTVQGAESTAIGNTFATQQVALIDRAPDLIRLLEQIAADLRERELYEDDAAMIEAVAQDLKAETASARTDESSLSRLRSRFKQAGLTLAALAAASSGANELITQAQDLIHSVLG